MLERGNKLNTGDLESVLSRQEFLRVARILDGLYNCVTPSEHFGPFWIAALKKLAVNGMVGSAFLVRT